MIYAVCANGETLEQGMYESNEAFRDRIKKAGGVAVPNKSRANPVLEASCNQTGPGRPYATRLDEMQSEVQVLATRLCDNRDRLAKALVRLVGDRARVARDGSQGNQTEGKNPGKIEEILRHIRILQGVSAETNQLLTELEGV